MNANAIRQRILYADNHENNIRCSSVVSVHSTALFRGVSLKYVMSGSETYHTNAGSHRILSGYFLVGNSTSRGEVQIQGTRATEGLCIDLSPQLVREVATSLPEIHSDAAEFLLHEKQAERRFHYKSTESGRLLQVLAHSLPKTLNDTESKEFLTHLAAALLYDQSERLCHLDKTPFIRWSAKHDVVNALLHAKALMEAPSEKMYTLEEISAEIAMSKFHFSRLFKRVFHCTPQQYQTQSRLTHLRKAIAGGMKIADAAHLAGYADVPSFSKAFKRTFGHSPGAKKQFWTSLYNH